MISVRTAALALCCVGFPATAAVPADPAIVPLFEAACTKGELSFAAREAAIAADSEWVAQAVSDVNVQSFGAVPVKPVSMNFNYSKPLVVKQWNRSVGGSTVRVVLAQFDPKRRYPNLCAVVVANVQQSAMDYIDLYRPVVEAVGLRGKSVDLAHYFEFSGKLPDGHPVRSDIFTRSSVLGSGKTMHMYLAF
ncbi:hypothetical protein [Sandarakinorhabdus sp.]|uniref:hypothetical protein n=1 Tax=Sandarakinorhabdus sp. TaxID=1916663 RepID=UPI00286E5864|nr:hypothetical protein [Sandarakinorhabdus sp.]